MIFWAWLNPLANEGDWISILALGVLAGVLALDETSFGQTWLCQPLPAGILAGAVCGDPQTGLAIGLPFQLISIGSLPVGQTFTGEKVSSVIAVVGGAVLSGQRLGLLGGSGFGEHSSFLGWVLIAVVLFSLLGHRIVLWEQRMHFAWMLEGHRGLKDGDVRRFDRIQVRCLAASALRGLALTWLWLAISAVVWQPLYLRLPYRVVDALAVMPLLAIPIAVGALVDRYGLRVCWRWVLGGLLTSLLLMKAFAVA